MVQDGGDGKLQLNAQDQADMAGVGKKQQLVVCFRPPS